MTTGSPARLLLKFALPLVIGNVLQQFYNMADTAIAGHLLGDQALAQIGATSALYSLITNFCFGMNNGLSLAVSRSFGANDKKEMKQSVCWMINLSLSFGIILMAAFLIFRRPLLAALQTPDDVIRGALNYLTIILIGIPLTMIYNLESGLLRAVGNSITPLWFLLFSSILNVILDLAFMGPLNMGVSGAAIATVLSQGISALLGLLYIMRFYPEFRFAKETLRVPLSFVTGHALVRYQHGAYDNHFTVSAALSCKAVLTPLAVSTLQLRSAPGGWQNFSLPREPQSALRSQPFPARITEQESGQESCAVYKQPS